MQGSEASRASPVRRTCAERREPRYRRWRYTSFLLVPQHFSLKKIQKLLFNVTLELEQLPVGVDSIAPADGVPPNTPQESIAQLVGGMPGVVHCGVRGLLSASYFCFCSGATALKFTVIFFASGVSNSPENDGVCVFELRFIGQLFVRLLWCRHNYVTNI